MRINQTLPYLSIFLLFILTTTTNLNAQPFSCKSTSKCNSIIDYVSPNATTIFNITSLFGISKNLSSFLSVNKLPPTTESSHSIKANQTVRIPFPCRCADGTGTSDGLPVYKVVPDDGLFHIASDVFGGLVLFPQIQAANKIADANKIFVGQELKIPLPCSCDDVDGEAVVHYGHVVPKGSTVEGIAKEFNTTQETLLKLNGLATPAGLKAGVVLDVPLKACNSSINLTTISTCASNSPPTPSSATKISSQGWRWNFLIAVQLVLLSLHLFQ